MLSLNACRNDTRYDAYIQKEGYKLMKDIAKAIKESVDEQKRESQTSCKKGKEKEKEKK